MNRLLWPQTFSIADDFGYSDLDNGTNHYALESPSMEVLANDDLAPSKKTISVISKKKLIWAIHVMLFISYMSWTLIVTLRGYTHTWSCEPGPNLIYSPAREAVSYGTVLMNNTIEDQNPFKGEPRPEQDRAWRDILRWGIVAVDKDDLEAIDRTSIEVRQGGKYIATLDVFHELHCLNLICEHIYRDYYPTLETPERNLQHVDHCIDTLRQIMMCHGDISLVTFNWVAGEHDPFSDFNVNRECRDWDRILDWAKAHHAGFNGLERPPPSGGKLKD